ncbi:NAD(P)-dependent oxidoreductase [Rhizosphaericola mali]|uniref:Lactate dehydrogenase n=1 Tax=Rhizosphaericola mali TaxID=2545455 RepID=A0A5P2FVL1_9BACT|nr:NAD(P)-dependent oxidoreductase [Rhizosphaericola mali]QES87175.1 lactate dehydrogenase [Rhizosphaericola mali]
MKIIAFETRNDESEYFAAVEKEKGIELKLIPQRLTIANKNLLEGFQGVSILGHSEVNIEMLDTMKSYGISRLSTRTIGLNHIDVNYAKSIGIEVTNSTYDPACVAEFAIMMMLMSLRKYKQAMFRANVNDYSLKGLQGKELKNCKVGIIGTGGIGLEVIKILNGFGCEVLAYSPSLKKKNNLGGLASVVDYDALLQESDIISLHLPLNDNTHHMINQQAIDKMKDGVILINCSRGGLMDVNGLIRGIETRKISALALDVFENESEIYHFDRRLDIISNKDMAYLRQFPNVIMTQHIAFYTESSIESMVRVSLDNLTK